MRSGEIARENLLSDIKVITKDVDELVDAKADKNALEQGVIFLKEKSKHGAQIATNFAHDNPRSTVGIALGTAAILGLLLWTEFSKR
jgi:ElaB/YqjD/DUF883 family membrane-anchored ribosome-binding protein